MIAFFKIVHRAFQIVWIISRVFVGYQIHYLACLFISARSAQARRTRLHKRMAIRIRDAAIRLRGIFIKLGQVMSTRIDLLPEEFTDELSVLQDQVPPAPFETIRQRIVYDLGRDIQNLFSHFSPDPIAAASLGQVHEAYLSETGQKVAVKIQYPDIQRVIAADLRILRRLTVFLKFWFPTVRFDILYEEFSHIIRDELNYVQEGRNAERFARQFSGEGRVIVPRVLWQYSTQHILTLEFVDGIKINQTEAMQAKGIDPRAVAGLVAEVYMRQILEHRFFHADPHPGNLFVRSGPAGGPQLVFVDFGQMQAITDEMYGGIKRTIKAIILRDTPSIALGLQELGFVDPGQDRVELEKAVDFFMVRYRDMKPREFRRLTIQEIAQDVRQLFRIFPYLHIPNHFILFARTATMLNGLCSKLDPDLNIIELARPHAQRFITAGEEKGLSEALGTWLEFGLLLLNLPRRLDEFLTAAKTQGIKTQMSSEDMTRVLTRIYHLGQSTLLGLTLLGLTALYLYLKTHEMTTEATATLIGIGAFSVWFFRSLIKSA